MTIIRHFLNHPLLAFLALLLITFLCGILLGDTQNTASEQIRGFQGLSVNNIHQNTLTAGSSLMFVRSNYEMDLFRVAEKTGYSYNTLYRLWNCEARLKHDNVWGKAGEYGGFQYKLRTFKYYCNKFGEDLNILSFKDQAYLTAKVLQNGGSHNWTCWDLINN